ncbi:MAG: VanZ family protein [Bacteroides sp.]|nr:VanZ family protein [Bacteroides sp.]MCM1380210.1 VanZ family protein [Bacteroides sp.]MCM1446132.1 VanZ family protein [Prevotella sp.]
MMRLLLRIPRWNLSTVCFVLISYLTLAPKPLPDNDIPFWEHTDKVVHAIMFAAMYSTLYIDLWRGHKPNRVKRWLLGLPVAAFGGIIELLQQAMHMGRGGDVYDFAADCCGMVLAIWLAPLFFRIRS